jgi:hypothetical protein
MKQETLTRLGRFKELLRGLRRDISVQRTKCVARVAQRRAADAIATLWVEELRSPLEHKFKLPSDVIESTSEAMKHLHVLSRPNNLASSYLQVLDGVLKDFDDRFILPIQQTSSKIERILDLTKLIPALPNPDESTYLKEAVECASSGHHRAAIVMGWCCAIDRIQRRIAAIGFQGFNAASTTLKNQTSGKFKRWNKEFSISTLSELQQIFDTDLIVVLEGMSLLDGNQAQRLETCFQYRCHSAHPGQAPIGEAHVIAFFTDIAEIILQNPKFNI